MRNNSKLIKIHKRLIKKPTKHKHKKKYKKYTKYTKIHKIHKNTQNTQKYTKYTKIHAFMCQIYITHFNIPPKVTRTISTSIERDHLYMLYTMLYLAAMFCIVKWYSLSTLLLFDRNKTLHYW